MSAPRYHDSPSLTAIESPVTAREYQPLAPSKLWAQPSPSSHALPSPSAALPQYTRERRSSPGRRPADTTGTPCPGPPRNHGHRAGNPPACSRTRQCPPRRHADSAQTHARVCSATRPAALLASGEFNHIQPDDNRQFRSADTSQCAGSRLPDSCGGYTPFGCVPLTFVACGTASTE